MIKVVVLWFWTKLLCCNRRLDYRSKGLWLLLGFREGLCWLRRSLVNGLLFFKLNGLKLRRIDLIIVNFEQGLSLSAAFVVYLNVFYGLE